MLFLFFLMLTKAFAIEPQDSHSEWECYIESQSPAGIEKIPYLTDGYEKKFPPDEHYIRVKETLSLVERVLPIGINKFSYSDPKKIIELSFTLKTITKEELLEFLHKYPSFSPKEYDYGQDPLDLKNCFGELFLQVTDTASEGTWLCSII